MIFVLCPLDWPLFYELPRATILYCIHFPFSDCTSWVPFCEPTPTRISTSGCIRQRKPRGSLSCTHACRHAAVTSGRPITTSPASDCAVILYQIIFISSCCGRRCCRPFYLFLCAAGLFRRGVRFCSGYHNVPLVLRKLRKKTTTSNDGCAFFSGHATSLFWTNHRTSESYSTNRNNEYESYVFSVLLPAYYYTVRERSTARPAAGCRMCAWIIEAHGEDTSVRRALSRFVIFHTEGRLLS